MAASSGSCPGPDPHVSSCSPRSTSALDSFSSFTRARRRAATRADAEAAAFIVGRARLRCCRTSARVGGVLQGGQPTRGSARCRRAGRSLRFALRRPRAAASGSRSSSGVVLMLGFIALPRSRASGSSSRGAWPYPALLFERVGAFKALGRSFRLVRGRWWPSCLPCSSATCSVSVSAVVSSWSRRRSPPASRATATSRRRRERDRRTISAMITTLHGRGHDDPVLRPAGAQGGLRPAAAGRGVRHERDPDAPLPAPLIGDE